MKECSINGCGRQAARRGWCPGHYARWYKHGDVHSHIPLRSRIGRCKVDHCEREHNRHGYCEPHWNRVHQHGDPQAHIPIRQFAPSGSGSINGEGYRYISRNGKQRGEHLYIMEDQLGRKLYSDETVHHKNGIRHDNRLANLELRASGHGKGQTIPDLLVWAHEIISRYQG